MLNAFVDAMSKAFAISSKAEINWRACDEEDPAIIDDGVRFCVVFLGNGIGLSVE